MEIEYISVLQLNPYKQNARKHAKQDINAIKASIKEFGFNDPIGLWGDNIIVEGHGRLIAAKELGMEKVPIIRLDHLTDEQRRAYGLAHNKTAELSEWDADILPLELADIADINMSDFGFDISPLESSTDIIEDEYEITLPTEAKTKQGNIYQLGRHRLICGDSTDVDVINKLMDGAKADLLLTDPPYNVDYTGKTKDALKIKNDKKADAEFRQFLDDAFLCAISAMKEGASFYIWHADSEGYNFRGACNDVGLTVRQCLIWVKNSMVLGRQDYQWQHEPCLYGWKEGAGHTWYSDRKQTTVLEFARPTRSAEHPTMKPVALFDYEIKNSTKAGDIVLDPFAGSGTTIIACEQNNRSAYCVELDPQYCDVIIDRWERFTGQKAVLVNV